MMAKTFMINQLMIKSENKMRLERLQQEKEMITQLFAYYIINTTKIRTN